MSRRIVYRYASGRACPQPTTRSRPAPPRRDWTHYEDDGLDTEWSAREGTDLESLLGETPACYGRGCDRPGAWVGTTRHDGGQPCGTVTACAVHRDLNAAQYRRLLVLLGVVMCAPHSLPMTLTWRRL